MIYGIWKNYQEYLCSDAWKQRSQEIINNRRHCEFCGESLKHMEKKAIFRNKKRIRSDTRKGKRFRGDIMSKVTRFDICIITTRHDYKGMFKPTEKYCRNNCPYHSCKFNTRYKHDKKASA